MYIVCNGQQREIDKDTTLESLLTSLELPPDTVVAEVNETIIDRNQYQATCLQDGDRVELIRFVGGG